MKRLLCILGLFFGGLFSQNLHAEIRIVTGDIQPFSYRQDDQQVGVGPDIVKEICQRLSIHTPSTVYPWARAVNMSTQPDTIIYPFSRMSSREQNYVWVGPIYSDNLVFITAASNTTSFTSHDDFKHMKRIGVIRSSASHQRLIKLGFDNIEDVNDEKNNALKLEKNRISAWYASELITQHVMRQLKIDHTNYRVAYIDLHMQVYIGMSLNLKDEATRWQHALNAMKQDGTYARILKHHHIPAP